MFTVLTSRHRIILIVADDLYRAANDAGHASAAVLPAMLENCAT